MVASNLLCGRRYSLNSWHHHDMAYKYMSSFLTTKDLLAGNDSTCLWSQHSEDWADISLKCEASLVWISQATVRSCLKKGDGAYQHVSAQSEWVLVTTLVKWGCQIPPQDSLQPSVTPVLENPNTYTWCTYMHVNKIFKYTKKFFKKVKLRPSTTV